MSLTEFIKPEFMFLVAVLYVIGAILKKSEKFADKYIPALLATTGAMIAVLWVLGTTPLASAQEAATAVCVGLVQGVLCAGAAVGVNQAVVVQPRKDE